MVVITTQYQITSDLTCRWSTEMAGCRLIWVVSLAVSECDHYKGERASTPTKRLSSAIAYPRIVPLIPPNFSEAWQRALGGPPWVGAWTRWPPGVPSNLSRSVKLIIFHMMFCTPDTALMQWLTITLALLLWEILGHVVQLLPATAFSLLASSRAGSSLTATRVKPQDVTYQYNPRCHLPIQRLSNIRL